MRRPGQPLFIAGHGLGKQTSILRGANYATQLNFSHVFYKFVIFAQM